MRFRGASAINLDAKGRLAIPTKYRERLLAHDDGCLVATIDTDQPCLLIYPLAEWEEIQTKVEALPSFNPLTRRIQRLLIGHATDVEMDSSSRILVPPLLREHAGLDKRCILVGQGKKFELWSEERWADRLSEDLALGKGDEGVPAELSSLSL
ncbi:division/cell wall cluster transcriptional repressor MraZ [Aestuariirhabdus sp. LZHN29]|uniref:division/cell wall cluster transcriptional repressor MraZ n=1 Tax=Aestuariirhabdus sp. LZHN29 TaxID=3417462 RepID=UPI003CE88613